MSGQIFWVACEDNPNDHLRCNLKSDGEIVVRLSEVKGEGFWSIFLSPEDAIKFGETLAGMGRQAVEILAAKDSTYIPDASGQRQVDNAVNMLKVQGEGFAKIEGFIEGVEAANKARDERIQTYAKLTMSELVEKFIEAEKAYDMETIDCLQAAGRIQRGEK